MKSTPFQLRQSLSSITDLRSIDFLFFDSSENLSGVAPVLIRCWSVDMK